MATAPKTTDIAVEANKSVFDDEALHSITNMSEALAALGSITDIEDFSDYGTGFEIIENKDRLVGVPFVILEWRFTKSKQYDQEFTSAICVDEKDNKFIVNDGSTGIYSQLRMVTDRRLKNGKAMPQTGLVCRNGLRRSDYTVERDGKDLQASTYYIA